MEHKLLCRMESLNSTKDIKGRGAHNVRSTDKLSNPDINRDLTKNNIHLIGGDDIYQSFQEKVKDVKEKYEEWNESRALNRQKTWKQYLDTARNNVSTEFVLTAGLSFFEELKDANIDISDYFEKQLEFFEDKFPDYRIYSAIVHMDEKTPHLHLLGVPVVECERGAELQINQSRVFGGRKEMYDLQEEYFQFNKKFLDEYNIVISKEISTANHIPPAILKSMQSDMRLGIKQDIDVLERQIPKGKEVFVAGEVQYLLNQKEYNTIEKMVETQKHEITREHQIEYLDEKLNNFDNYKIENNNLKLKVYELEIENKEIVSNVTESQKELVLDLETTEKENTYLKEKIKRLEEEELQRLLKIKKALEMEDMEKERKDKLLKQLLEEEELARLKKIAEEAFYKKDNEL